MIIRVRAFANFKEILGRDLNVELVEGSNVKDLLDNLSTSHHRFRSAIFDESGQIREYVILMKNRKNIDFLSDLETKLSEGDEVGRRLWEDDFQVFYEKFKNRIHNYHPRFPGAMCP